MTTAMIAFPLPFLTCALAMVAGALVVRHDFGSVLARAALTGFFGLVALGSLLLGLRFGYGFEQLIALQRMVPLFIGPSLWLGFAGLTMPEDAARRRTALHLGAAFVAALVSLALPAAADWLIGVTYLCYAALLLALWRRGPNHLIRAPLSSASAISAWSACAAVLLLAMLLSDTVIALSFARNRSGDAVMLISGGATLMALLLLYVIFGAASGPARHATPETPRPLSPDNDRILAAAEALILREVLYKDPTLTAERLARRLHLPTRALSEAVNQRLGVNLSQYVNGFRLRRAAELLAGTDLDLAQVMAQSGFLSRSNLYREFQRVYGRTPVAYRRELRS